jgi:hypothetical protein
MTTDPQRTEAGVPWRRRALTLGGLATAAWATVLGAGLLDRASSAVVNVASWLALVLSFVTTYLLSRMWSHASYAGNAPAALGRRLSAAFEILVAVIVVLAVVGVGAPLLLVLGCTAVACFFAALVLGLRRPTAG